MESNKYDIGVVEQIIRHLNSVGNDNIYGIGQRIDAKYVTSMRYVRFMRLSGYLTASKRKGLRGNTSFYYSMTVKGVALLHAFTL